MLKLKALHNKTLAMNKLCCLTVWATFYHMLGNLQNTHLKCPIGQLVEQAENDETPVLPVHTD
jgi:DNA mismatch repair ATPase MutS